MSWKRWLIIIAAALMLTSTSETFSQAPEAPVSPHIMTNRDILQLVGQGMQSHLIIAKIMTSRCNFDVFPPVLADLKRRGVPENVLHFMSFIPNGPASLPEPRQPNSQPLVKAVKIPRGTVVTVETLYPVSSADFKLNSTVAFSVVSPVIIDGAVVIPRGTIARAKIIHVKKAGSFGRAGALTFEMERIVAMDGTKIPVQLSAAAEGGSRAGTVAIGAGATAALIFPYTAPAAIVWGFKKGDDAVVRGSKQFAAVVKAEMEVSGLVPEKDRLIYHYTELLKAKESAASTPTQFPRLPVRN